jgi:hypothetical protein
MAYTAISGIVPQLSRNSGGAAANGYYLKAYEAGTTTPLSMGIDNTPTATLAKCRLNSRGEPISNDADETTVFIPHFDESYKLALFVNANDADNNLIANAVWVVDNITGIFDASLINVTISGTDVNLQRYLNSIDVDSYNDFRDDLNDFKIADVPDGTTINFTNDGISGQFVAKSGSPPADNGGTIIVSNIDPNRYVKRDYDGAVYANWFDNDFYNSSNISTAVNAALALQQSVIIPPHPEGNAYPYSDPIQIKYNGQALMGGGGTHDTHLRWAGTDSTENAIEIWTGRRDLMNNSLAVTNQFLRNFRLTSASGSDVNTIIWIEAGAFHGVIEKLRIENLNGATPMSAVVKYDSNGGQSYPVNFGMRDVTITGSTNDDLSPILRGVWLEGAIEGYFDHVFVYTVEEAWVLGTATTANIRNVANCKFFGCQGEIGDRGFATGDATSLRIYQARDVDFVACKFLAGADFASPTNQTCVKFSQDSTFQNRNIRFDGCAFWGQGGCNYLIQFTSSITDTFDVFFDQSSIVEPAVGVVTVNASVDPLIHWGDQTYIDSSPAFAKFQSRAQTIDPSSIADGGGELFTFTNDISPVGGEPLIHSLGVDRQGLLETGYRNSTAGSYRYRLDNKTGGPIDLASSQLRFRFFHKEERLARYNTLYDAGSISDGAGETVTHNFYGVELGDFVIAGLFPANTGALDQMILSAYVSSSGVVSTRLQNESGSGTNLSSGQLEIIKAGDFDGFGSKTYNAPSLASGAQTTTTVNVTGVALGDFAIASLDIDLQGIVMQAYVSSNDVATVILYNGTAGVLDLASATLRVGCYKRYTTI